MATLADLPARALASMGSLGPGLRYSAAGPTLSAIVLLTAKISFRLSPTFARLVMTLA